MRIEQALQFAREQLAEAEVPNAEREAWVLLSALLNQPRAWVMAHPEFVLSPAFQRKLTRWLQRRARREPLAYITHRRWFYGLELEIRRGVLVPRPETELLVERFVQWATSIECPLGRGQGGVLVDAGVGSGAIAVASLVHLPHWQGIGTDISPKALRVAQLNRARFRLGERLLLTRMRWLSGLRPQSAHAVLSNPPYVLPDEWDALEPEIRLWEPRTALLVPAKDPLRPYRVLATQATQVLIAGGLLLLETSPRLAPLLAEQLPRWGFKNPQVRRDYSNLERVVYAIVE